jgi:hypothetical protein
MDFQDPTLFLTKNGVSHHVTPIQEIEPRNGNTEWNENNDGIGLLTKQLKNSLIHELMIGQYKNSLGNNSIYGAYGLKKRLFDNGFHIDGGITAGLVSGYDIPIAPMLLPTLSIGNDNFDFNIRYQPRVGDLSPEVFMFNTDYRIK